MRPAPSILKAKRTHAASRNRRCSCMLVVPFVGASIIAAALCLELLAISDLGSPGETLRRTRADADGGLKDSLAALEDLQSRAIPATVQEEQDGVQGHISLADEPPVVEPLSGLRQEQRDPARKADRRSRAGDVSKQIRSRGAEAAPAAVARDRVAAAMAKVKSKLGKSSQQDQSLVSAAKHHGGGGGAVEKAQLRPVEPGPDEGADDVGDVRGRNVWPIQALLATPPNRTNAPQENLGETPEETRERLQTEGMKDPALLLICFNRPKYLERTIESLSRLEGLKEMTVYISQDGNVDRDVTRIAKAAVGRGGALAPPVSRASRHWQHPRNSPTFGAKQRGHAWLSQHYKWAMEEVFVRGHSHVVVVEDDMEFSPDFLLLFQATAWLLEADESLMCVSSWNDYGFPPWRWRPGRLLRTSFFPGLGWMTTRRVWKELRRTFPDSNWDNVVRVQALSKGWECVVPEINRNYNFGEFGANMKATDYAQLDLGHMKHYDGNATHDLFDDVSYLLPSSADLALQQELRSAVVVEWGKRGDELTKATKNPDKDAVYMALYKASTFRSLSKALALGHESPRLNYQGVTRLPLKRQAVLLLVNQQGCVHLPESLKSKPPRKLKVVVGSRGQTCSGACRAAKMACNANGFDFINTCTALEKVFQCPRGCGQEVGSDLPAMVVVERDDNFRMCVTNVDNGVCDGHNSATQRLCPCMPL